VAEQPGAKNCVGHDSRTGASGAVQNGKQIGQSALAVGRDSGPKKFKLMVVQGESVS
jgi:hypothetical protein